ncbi:hypothetical protein [Nonomuraea cavernae]|uniref:hypothetical protein n=1 Tax=Nonomuraea cavernae TaxID=2045107 RepID=UPI0033EA05D0
MTASLHFVAHELINFRNGSYAWIDVRRFQLAGWSGDDMAALDLLLRHERYRDDYASGDSVGLDSRRLHGPFLLSRVTAGSFEPVDEASAHQLIRTWAKEIGFLDPVPEELAPRLETHVYDSLCGATERYKLRELGEEAMHDYGLVLWDFWELVLLNRSDASLTLVVGAVD